MEGNAAHLTTWDFFIPLARRLGYSDAVLCSKLDGVTVGKLATYSGFYVSKGSKVTEAFNVGLTHILQHGLHNRHYTKFLQENTLKCFSSSIFIQKSKSEHSQALRLQDTSTAFGLLILAMLISVCLMFLEIGSTHIALYVS